MTANPAFDRALCQPVRAVARGLAPRPATMQAPLVAQRMAAPSPAAAPAPRIQRPAPLPTGASPTPRRGAAKGAVLMSTALHLGLVAGWAVFASPARPLLTPDLETAAVSLISEAAFQALTAPQPVLAMAAAPAPLAPLAEAPTEPQMAAPQMAAPEMAAPAVPLAVPHPDLAALQSAPPSPAPLPDLATAPTDALPLAPAATQPPPPRPKVKETRAAEPQAEKPVKKPAPKADQKSAQKSAEKAEQIAEQKPAAKAAKAAAAAPTAAPAKAASASPGEAKALKADWGAKVRARINRKVALPADSSPGTVKVRIDIAPSGALLAVGIAQSSGQPALDAAALKAVKSAAPFARAPKGLSEARYSFSLPITFKS